MFHELFAFGPPWSSSFWTSPFQRALAARVARLSDRCFTNRKLSALQLESWAPAHAAPVQVFPVFSNFGELPAPPPLAQRPPHSVHFGGIGRTMKNRPAALALIARACRQLGIERLFILGDAPDASAPLGSVAVETLKSVSASAASQLLSRTRIGFLDYFDGYLGKSSFFAAYCSHGVAPVLLAPNSSESDGLLPGKHFLVADSLLEQIPISQQQQIADAAFTWYRPHDLPKTANAIANTLNLGHPSLVSHAP